MFPKSLIILFLFAALGAAPTGLLRAQWVSASGPFGGEVNCLAVSGSNLFAGLYGIGVFFSSDSGTSWAQVNNGLPNVVGINVFCLAVLGNNIYASVLEQDTFVGFKYGIYVSSNDGMSWTSREIGLPDTSISSLAVSGSIIFAGTQYGEIFRSTDSGLSWSVASNGLPSSNQVSELVVSAGAILAATDSGIFRSTNAGDSWIAVNTGLELASYCLTASGNNVFVLDYHKGQFAYDSVARSTDNGMSWTRVESYQLAKYVYCIAVLGTDLFAGWGGGILRSTDSGSTWNLSNDGLVSTDSTGINFSVNSLIAAGTTLFVGLDSTGVFHSTDRGTSWIQGYGGITNADIRSFVVSDSILFAGTAGAGVFCTRSQSVNWISANNGLTNKDVRTLAKVGSNLYAGTVGGGVFLSTNNGSLWSPVNTGLTNNNILSMAVSGSWIFVGTSSGGVFLSTDSGASWNQANSGLPGDSILALAAVNSVIYAGTWGDGVFSSSDGGTSWLPFSSGLTNTYVRCLYGELAAGTNGGLFYLNNGSWSSESSLFLQEDTILAISSFTIGIVENLTIVGTLGDGAYVSGFPTWIHSTGLPSGTSVYAVLDTSFAFAPDPDSYGRPEAVIGGSNGGIWKGLFLVPEAVPQSQLPSGFRFAQNYPNPLSESTTIAFSTPESGIAEITIVNLLGSGVARVFSGELESGEHNFEWNNTSGLPDGVYQCLIRMNGRVETLPIVLLK